MPTTNTRPQSSTNSRSAVPLALANFLRFCGELKTEDGSAFKIYPLQKKFLRDYFEGIRETGIIMPKKNGKTTLLAALALYHLLVTENAECIMVAASRDQAEIILRQARMFIGSSPALQRVMKAQRREIVSLVDEGRIRVLASDVDTADGVIPTLAIVDELHRHKTSELYGVLMKGLGPRGGQILTISTAAARVDSPLGQLRQRAYDTPGMKRDGKYRYVRSKSLAFHELALDPEDDTENLKIVKLVNPAPWLTLRWLQEVKDSSTNSEWLRFECGIWTESEDPWLDPPAWDGLADKVKIADGAEVWLYVKKRGPIAVLLAIAKRGDRLEVQQTIWTEGISSETLEHEVRDACERWKVETVLYNPWEFKRAAELLEDDGLPMVEFPNTPERMAPASATLERLIEQKQLRHDGDEVLRSHVLAGTWKDSERGRRLVEDPVSRRPIDALIALAAAVHVAGVPSTEGKFMVAFR